MAHHSSGRGQVDVDEEAGARRRVRPPDDEGAEGGVHPREGGRDAAPGRRMEEGLKICHKKVIPKRVCGMNLS